MNAEIANRLYQYRKKSNLSQEELADKLGISRQAVSKWERAEASPDTDNLINLSKLYGVSLDELLNSDPAQGMSSNSANSEEAKQEKETESQNNESNSGKKQSNVHIGFDGIHVEDGDDSVHINLKGIHVEDSTDKVHIGLNGIHVQDKNGETVHIGRDELNNIKRSKHWEFNSMKPKWADIPIGIITLIAFIVMGTVWGMWGEAWLVFFLIPICHGFTDAILRRNAGRIPFFWLALAVFFSLGLLCNMWHPGWVVFLTIPIFKWLIK